MVVKNCALFLFQLSACWAVISGCTTDKSGTLVCKSIAELYQVNVYKELKKIKIQIEDDGGPWPVIKNDAFKGMNKLEALTIIGNVSHFERHALRGIAHPFKFYVVESLFNEIPEELFNGVQVTAIGVIKTHVQELKQNLFRNSPFLKEVNMQFSKLTEVKAGIFSNTDMAIVTLSGHEISIIEDGAFAGMKNLYLLDLDDNKLTTFDVEKILGSSSTIEILQLSGNLLTTIPTFPTLPKMRGVAVGKNGITKIESKCFANLKNLELLELSFNKLKSIPAGTLPGTLEKLGVGENPWTCSYLRELKAWAKKGKVKLMCGYGYDYEPCSISCI